MESSEISIDPLSIKSTLTLRYDLTQHPILQKLSWNNFTAKKEIPTNSIEDSIKNNISKSVNESEPEKVSISLSGGIDSSVVLLFLKQALPNTQIQAVSVKFSDSIDETDKAKEIANHLDVKHDILHVDNYLERLPKAIFVSGLPLWEIHWYYVVENARLFSEYLASGDGGDELFGGYVFRYSKFLSLINPRTTPLDKVKAYLNCHIRDHVPDQVSLFGLKSNFQWSDIYDSLIPYFDNPLNPLEQVFLADYNGKLLYNFSLFNTKIMDSFEMKPISPLLSQEMVTYSTQMSIEEKYDRRSNTGKLVLRKILKKHNMLKLFDDQKLGFSVNTVNLWRTHGQEICKDYLLESRVVKDGWINDEWIKKYVSKEDLDVRYVNKFYGLLAFEVWYRLFVTREINPDSKLSK